MTPVFVYAIVWSNRHNVCVCCEPATGTAMRGDSYGSDRTDYTCCVHWHVTGERL